jgi:hypothetical protein
VRVSALKIRGACHTTRAFVRGLALERCSVRIVKLLCQRFCSSFPLLRSSRTASHGACAVKLLGPKDSAQQNSRTMNYEASRPAISCLVLPSSSPSSRAGSLGSAAGLGSSARLAQHLPFHCSAPFSLPTVVKTNRLRFRVHARRPAEGVPAAQPAHASSFSHRGPTLLQSNRGATQPLVRRFSLKAPPSSGPSLC